MAKNASSTKLKPKQPQAKAQWKTEKVDGAEFSYMSVPGGKRPDFVNSMIEASNKGEAERKARAAADVARPAPDLTPRPCLVAFIDILGFRSEIKGAKTKKDLERIHRKVTLVQREFQNANAAADPQEQAHLNELYGKRVFAFSDCVVVAITPTLAQAPGMSPYDVLGLALYELILAQGRCACQGVFVRGGVSHGSFFFENDVLISPALVQAYELESSHADHPVIAIADATRKVLLKAGGNKLYDPEGEPISSYFRRLGRKKVGGRPLHHLDYISVMLNEEHRGMLAGDRKAYFAARKKDDNAAAQEIRSRSELKDAAFFLRAHRQAICRAYKATENERAREKYRWLMRYQNRSFDHNLKYVCKEVIDLEDFAKLQR